MNRAQLADAYALTLRSPWAHLVALYGKTVENRSWPPYEGANWLLIHAGQGRDPLPGFMRIGDWGNPHLSAIVAVADLMSVCDSSRYTSHVVCGCGEWALPGQLHWNLGNIQALPTPVPAKGGQGLWRPDSATLEAVAEQLDLLAVSHG